MNEESVVESSYRCAVLPEQATAKLKLGSRTVPVELVDISIDGFTISVNRKIFRTLRHDCRWTLLARDEVTIVHPEWLYQTPEGEAQIGLRRIVDETPTELAKLNRERFRGLFPRIDGVASLSGHALAGMVFLIIALVALPGVGDDLGTAPAIESAIGDFVLQAQQSLRSFLRS